MRSSTIAKHRAFGPDSEFARRLGAEIHRRRIALGLSQRQLAEPMSRAFVSLVEHGRVVPSLPSLALIADRLQTSPAALLLAVNPDWTIGYTEPHATTYPLPRRRGSTPRPPNRGRDPG